MKKVVRRVHQSQSILLTSKEIFMKEEEILNIIKNKISENNFFEYITISFFVYNILRKQSNINDTPYYYTHEMNFSNMNVFIGTYFGTIFGIPLYYENSAEGVIRFYHRHKCIFEKVVGLTVYR
jgi:hypothetical protein